MVKVGHAGIANTARNELRVAATCTRCGTHAECRLHDVLRGHTKSCKCLRPEQYLVNVSALADRIPEPKLARMWAKHFSGADRWAIATAYRLAVEVVDFGLRRYQQILDHIINTGHALMVACATPTRSGQPRQAVPAKVAEYLKKTEMRYQNIMRRARESEAERKAGDKAWDWKMREWWKEQQDSKINIDLRALLMDPGTVVEFS
jgi:hypothetical protein